MPRVEIHAVIRPASCEFTIGDRKLHLDMSERGVTRLIGSKGDELDNTIGGILADALFSKFGDISRALSEIHPETPVWGNFKSDSDRDDFYDAVV